MAGPVEMCVKLRKV